MCSDGTTTIQQMVVPQRLPWADDFLAGRKTVGTREILGF
jgi:hypothetical protein